MNWKSQNGINLITLSVAIIIMVLITSVLVYSSKDGVKIRNLKDLYNDIELLDNKIASYYVKHGDIPRLKNATSGENIKYENVSFLNNANYEEVNPNNGNDYYIIDLTALEGITLNYGKDFEDAKNSGSTDYNDLYIINEASHTIYYPRGINVNGVRYYTYGDEWKKVDISIIPIETAEQLSKVGSNETVSVSGVDYTFSSDGTYVLKSDIDLSSICNKVDGTIANDRSWTPLCRTEETAFTGKFYGNGHEIRNLYIHSAASKQGLFGVNNGTIQDITVEGNINSTSGKIGGIVGQNNDNGKIVNCNSKATITAMNYTGGITGQNSGIIKKCKNYYKIEGTVENTDNGKVGGITGDNLTGGIIEQSYNEGHITGKSNGVGGICGNNGGILTLNINNAVVSSIGNTGTGGIVGVQYTSNDAKTVNCYNLKEINGKTNVGGIVGLCSIGQVLNCFSIGTVSGTSNTKSVIGSKSATNTLVRNNFFINTLSTTDENATPKTIEEMKSQAFVDLLNQGQIEQPWTMDTYGINDGYPVLKWQNEELK